MDQSPSSQTVLVTGAAGFIAMHCVLKLLENGYRVRGTLRSLARETQLRQIFMRHIDIGDRLEFVINDLLKDDGWNEAVNGCEYVLHIALPFPFVPPENARDGTLRVLKASAAGGIQRVVVTSTMLAILRGHTAYNKTFDESDWTNLEGSIDAYVKSKTLAEHAAWDFINQQDPKDQLELSVINPGLVLGPPLDSEYLGSSAQFIRRILAGENTNDLQGRVEVVDVRDVASAHVAAMTNPIAAGKRYCCVAGVLWWYELIQILDQHFASSGYKIHNQEPPDLVERSSKFYDISTKRIIQELGWRPRSAEEAIVAMGESLILNGMV
jgi:nucleoside-diphosphate-sugar epimerase